MDNKEAVLIDYTNWRGIRSQRRIIPERIVFKHSQWHPETQWILYAFDVEVGAPREFAMRDIHGWKTIGSDRPLGIGSDAGF